MTAQLHATLRRSIAIALALMIVCATGAPASRAAARPGVNFTHLQAEFMCTFCHEPLNVAQSSEAYAENATLRGLVDQGLTVPQIKQRMIQAYGEQVLGRPPAHGFNLLVYVVPPLVIVIGLVTVGVTLPRWRRRTRENAAAQAQAPAAPLSPADQQRLDADLARNL